MPKYIYEHKNWTNFSWDEKAILVETKEGARNTHYKLADFIVE